MATGNRRAGGRRTCARRGVQRVLDVCADRTPPPRGWCRVRGRPGPPDPGPVFLSARVESVSERGDVCVRPCPCVWAVCHFK